MENGIGRRWRLGLFAFRRQVSTFLALLFHVLNDARNSILADYRHNVITFLHLIRILSRRRHTKADLFSAGVLYGVVPSLNVCQLSGEAIHRGIRRG